MDVLNFAPRWLTRNQAALYAQVSEATIGREVRAGRLRCARVGGRRAMRFREVWIDQWLEYAYANQPHLTALDRIERAA
jgi:excisionase family DNA binding protein